MIVAPLLRSLSPLPFPPPNRQPEEPRNYALARDTWLRVASGGHDALWSASLGDGHVDLHGMSVPLGVGKFQEAFEDAAGRGVKSVTVITGSPQGPFQGLSATVLACMKEAGAEAWIRQQGNSGRFTVEGGENVVAVRDGLRGLREGSQRN